MNEKDKILEIFFKEYDKLKSEQAQRIGFRDNLLYVTLGLFGTVISFAISSTANRYALLVVPWICLILGWTYVVNDEKISAIGKYIRYKLIRNIKQHVSFADLEALFGWEFIHREDTHRLRRKIQQLLIDEITFVFSGIAALSTFWTLVPSPHLGIIVLSAIEFLLLILLGIEIFIYADLKKDNSIKIIQ